MWRVGRNARRSVERPPYRRKAGALIPLFLAAGLSCLSSERPLSGQPCSLAGRPICASLRPEAYTYTASGRSPAQLVSSCCGPPGLRPRKWSRMASSGVRRLSERFGLTPARRTKTSRAFHRRSIGRYFLDEYIFVVSPAPRREMREPVFVRSLQFGTHRSEPLLNRYPYL